MLCDILLIISVWIFCGLVAYGGAYAQTSSEVISGIPVAFDVAVRWFALLLGPIGLIAVTLWTRCFLNGLRFR